MERRDIAGNNGRVAERFVPEASLLSESPTTT
jgi:hypothetical protein